MSSVPYLSKPMWCIVRDEDGVSYRVSKYHFVGYVTKSLFIMTDKPIESEDALSSYLLWDTATHAGTNLYVVRASDCYESKLEAQIAMSDEWRANFDG